MTMEADLTSVDLPAALAVSCAVGFRSLRRLLPGRGTAVELVFRLVIRLHFRSAQGSLSFNPRRISGRTAGALAWAALILVPSTVCGQKTESDLETLDLTGRVRQVKESVEYQGSEGKPNSKVDMVYRFNPDGTLSEYVAYSSGQVQGSLVYSHNHDGSRSEKIVHSGGQGPTFRREVKTDRDGRQIQLSESCDDGFLIYAEKYKYQPDGTVEVSKYDHYNELLRVQHLKYENGKIAEIGGPGDFLEVRTYFSGGHPKESKIYVSRKLASYESYAYTFDKFGNWVVRHIRRLSSETDKAGTETTDYRAITYYSADGSGEGETTGVRPGSDSSTGTEQSPLAVIRQTGGVLQGSAWRRVEPAYPPAAKSGHITGAVVVQITIDECGRVVSSHALSGPPELREAAEHAARRWLFSQTRLNRIPVKVIGTVTFNFCM